MRRAGRRANTVEQLPSRYVPLSGITPPPPVDPPRTGFRTAALLVVMAAVVVGVLVWAWRWPGPAPAQGREGRSAAAHDVVSAALEAARAYVLRGEPAKADAVLREAITRFPDDHDLRVARAEVLLGLGREPEAYAEYVAALAIGPRPAALEFAAGTVALRLGQGARAVEHFALARAQEPSNAAYALYLGQAQLAQGELSSAKASLLQAAHLDESNAVAWGALAEIALRENNLHLAIQHARRARGLQPQVAAWRVIEARALVRQGDPEGALALLRALDPSELYQKPVLELAGRCYGLLRRPELAAALYASAAEASRGDAELLYQTALWFQRAGDRGEALAYAQRAQAAGHPDAEALAQRLAAGGD